MQQNDKLLCLLCVCMVGNGEKMVISVRQGRRTLLCPACHGNTNDCFYSSQGGHNLLLSLIKLKNMRVM